MNLLKNNNSERILSFIGLAKRAGKITTGEAKTVDSIRTANCELVILASDASQNTSKKISDKCKFYNKKLIVFSDKDNLGKYTKNDYAVVVSITDKGFADKITELYENGVQHNE